MPSRLITNNALIAFKIFHYLQQLRKSKKDFYALNVDMSKAYDRVKWLLLKKIMEKLGFPAYFIDIIMNCVTSISYSMSINGNPIAT